MNVIGTRYLESIMNMVELVGSSPSLLASLDPPQLMRTKLCSIKSYQSFYSIIIYLIEDVLVEFVPDNSTTL